MESAKRQSPRRQLLSAAVLVVAVSLGCAVLVAVTPADSRRLTSLLRESQQRITQEDNGDDGGEKFKIDTGSFVPCKWVAKKAEKVDFRCRTPLFDGKKTLRDVCPDECGESTAEPAVVLPIQQDEDEDEDEDEEESPVADSASTVTSESETAPVDDAPEENVASTSDVQNEEKISAVEEKEEVEEETEPTQQKEATKRTDGSRPNVIMLLAEDLGYGDLGCYGHPYAKTPNIDKLAEQGTKFMNFHSTGKTCAPARSGLMTSVNPAAMENYVADYGFEDYPTVTSLFNDAGYSNVGHYGKFHMGDDLNLHRKKGIYGMTDVKKISGDYKDYWFKDEAVYEAAFDFIKQNKNEPFYLNIWGHVAHSDMKLSQQHLLNRFKDLDVKKEDFHESYWDKLDRSKKFNSNINRNMAHYLGGVFSMDYMIGKLMDLLDDLDLADNTILVYTADHGAAQFGGGGEMLGYCGGLNGYKGSYLEGGVRVPFIARWPGKIPSGAVDNSPMSGLDWLPTVSSLANVPYDASQFQGEDFSDVWLGGGTRGRKSPLFWNKFGGNSSDNGDYAVLSEDGRWKLHFFDNKQWALYDLYNNIEEDESKNLINCKKEVAAKMKDQLRDWTRTLPKQYCRLAGADGGRLKGGCTKSSFHLLDEGTDGSGPQGALPWMATRSDITLYNTLPSPESEYECE